ncbi:DedA family protein [Halobacillus salinus]|uniref:DedA family protein n=1 Tax=Halobacillus salinus TaxID=192814 RepID=A0A4Z0H2D5_9BACI|nr:DedA family protein [Halobacillus salinus]TGB03566.1 DedA family protein [Halobacillus salinus]
MEHWLMEVMNQYGYIGILLLIALENIFPPIPSEVILTFGGFMTTSSDMSIVGVVVSSTIGSVIGAMVLYSIGLQLDVERLEKIVDKWGHVLRLSKSDIHKADQWFDKYGPWTVFFCRFVPLIRSLVSVPAGMSNMNFGVFVLLTLLGTSIWNIVLVNLGASVGESWEDVVSYMEIYANIIYIFLILLVIVLVLLVYKKKRR